MQFTIYGYKRMHKKNCIASFENYSINHTSVDLIAVAAKSRYNLRSRNATLLVLANAQCLPTDLVTEPFSRWLPNCVNCVNSLPAETRNIQSLTSFKTALKTYFLKIAFN